MPQLTAFRSILLVVLYCVIGSLGMMMAIQPGNVTPIYPAAGLAWALAILYKKQAYPIVFAGGMLTNLIPIFSWDTIVYSLATGISIGIGEVLSVIIANRILTYFSQHSFEFTAPKEILSFSIVATFWIVSPTVGVTSLYLGGYIEQNVYTATWLTWWLGDSIGILLTTPVLLIAHRQHQKGRMVTFNWGHFLASLSIALVLSLIIFNQQYPTTFLLTLTCLLCAFWLGQSSVMLINLVIATIATYATLTNSGPLIIGKATSNLLMLQLFIAVNVIASLLFWGKILHIKILGQKLSKAKFEARKDSLTNILNRRGFKEIASVNFNSSRRNDESASLLMFDIDNFKEVNDTHGHDVGDEVLVHLTEQVKHCIRAGDVFGRIGGEEFAILLSNATGNQAIDLSNRICKRVASQNANTVAGPITVTISLGVTDIKAEETLDEALHRADDLLYDAKAQGKNRVAAG